MGALGLAGCKPAPSEDIDARPDRFYDKYSIANWKYLAAVKTNGTCSPCVTHVLSFFERRCYVTAKYRATGSERGSSASRKSASSQWPESAAQAASITISDSTPAFTAAPMLGPMGC